MNGENIKTNTKEIDFTKHHIVFREVNNSLSKCPFNQIEVTREMHNWIHSKDGRWMARLLQLNFQNYIEILFDKREFDFKEIQETLQITKSCTERLLKNTPKNKNNCYNREDVIKAVMVKPISEEETKEIIKNL